MGQRYIERAVKDVRPTTPEQRAAATRTVRRMAGQHTAEALPCWA